MSHKYKPEIAKLGEEILKFNRSQIICDDTLPVEVQIAETLANLHHVAASNGLDWKDVVGKAGRYFQSDFDE